MSVVEIVFVFTRTLSTSNCSNPASEAIVAPRVRVELPKVIFAALTVTVLFVTAVLNPVPAAKVKVSEIRDTVSVPLSPAISSSVEIVVKATAPLPSVIRAWPVLPSAVGSV